MLSPAEALSRMTKQNGVPAAATLLVTDRCNYRCAHCYQEHTDREELSYAEIQRILGEMAEAGVLFLTLMGGEYFMRPDADEILRTAHELGFAIRLKTTGHHIHERRADLIASLRPIHVELSMYAASPHLHEGVTRQKGSWKRTFLAAKRLVERKVRVRLNAPVTEQTAADMGNLKRLASEIGAECSFGPRITTMENADSAPVSLRMTWKTMKAFYGHPTTGTADYLKETYGRIDWSTTEVRPLSVSPCLAGQNSVTVNPRGEVWPCNLLPIKCGDLRSQRFVDVWSSSKPLAEVRELRWASIAECNVCALRPFCDRCHAMALLEHGDLRGPSLESCRNAVMVRDSLRERGLIASDHTALPPTWDRVDLDGQHEQRDAQAGRGRRSAALRVLR